MKKFLRKTSSYILLLLILFNIGISYYVPRTNSKYITDGSISYDTNVYTIKNDFKVTFKERLISAGETYAKYEITFSRNKMLYSGDKDTYTVFARVGNNVNTCSLAPTYTTPSSDSGTAVKELLETSDLVSFSFTATCNVTNVVNSVNIHFKATEKIGNYTFIIGDITKTFNNSNLYNKILDDIENSTVYNSYDSVVRDYMKYYFMSVFTGLPDMYENKTLDGLTYSVDEYEYTFDEYFIGYAITQYANSDPTNNTLRFAFSSDNNIDNKFEYYLSKYLGYNQTYIEKVEDYILFKSGYQTIGEALLNLPTTSALVSGMRKSLETDALVSQVREIIYEKVIVENIVNIKYNFTNYIKIAEPSSGGTASMRTYFNNFVPYYGIDEILTSTSIGVKLRTAYLNLADNQSNIYILDSASTNSKLLINIYKKVEVENGETKINHYFSVTPLVDGTTITINNNALLNLYDLNSDPTASTYISATNYDESETLNIINTIGSYVYGTSYTNKTLADLNISEINNTITYTLSN